MLKNIYINAYIYMSCITQKKKELTNESISLSLSLSHTFPYSSLHSPINADLLSTSPFTVPIFFFLHLSPQVSLSFFFFFKFFAVYMIFSILISRFQCAEKGKEKKKRKLEVFQFVFFFFWHFRLPSFGTS